MALSARFVLAEQQERRRQSTKNKSLLKPFKVSHLVADGRIVLIVQQCIP